MNTEIKYHPQNNRFEAPRELGGHGLGTELVKYALAYAWVEHLTVIPTCSFVAALMDKHVVYQDLRKA